MNKLSTSIFTEPKFYLQPSAWVELVPAAFFIIEKLKPNTLVELGTHYGCSYFSFCQAIEKFNTNTRAFAVDNWLGDAHSGTYTKDVFEFVDQTNNNNFSHFSNLLRMNFDEAAKLFDNSSIDLLHIDGFHTYERVKHDFETWLPKMSSKGVVLFHDTQVRERNFGVWLLMDELKTKYPYFELEHGHGLGIVCTGEKTDPSFLEFIAASANDCFVQQVFKTSGKLIAEKKNNHQLNQKFLQTNGQLDAEKKTNQNLAHELNQTRAQLDAEKQNNQKLTHELNQTRAQHDAEKQSFLQATQMLKEELTSKKLQIGKLELEVNQNQSTIGELGIQIKSLQNSFSYKLTKNITSFLNKISGFKYFETRKATKVNTAIIEESALFDSNYYLSNNTDVAKSGMNAAKHYLLHGGFEGRKPNPGFDSGHYLQIYPDVKKAGINPLLHYILHGKREGRQPLPHKATN